MGHPGDDAFGDGETRYGTSGAGGPHSLAGAPPVLGWAWGAIFVIGALGAVSVLIGGGAVGGGGGSMGALVDALAIQTPANVQGGAAFGGVTAAAAGFLWAICNYGD